MRHKLDIYPVWKYHFVNRLKSRLDEVNLYDAMDYQQHTALGSALASAIISGERDWALG